VTAAANAYRRLEDRFARIRAIGDAESMLHWDLATMMPKGGAGARADQLAVLKSLRHELLTQPETADWLAEADAGLGDPGGLDEWQRANLAEMRRAHAHATALSPALVATFSASSSTRASAGSMKGWASPETFGSLLSARSTASTTRAGSPPARRIRLEANP